MTSAEHDTERLEIGRQRLQSVFSYLQALNHHRSPAKRQLREQPWHLSLADLPDHPSVQLSRFDPTESEDESQGAAAGSENDQPLLRVARPKLTQPPSPPPEIADWLSQGWDDPSGEIRTRPSRNIPGPDDQAITVAFEDDPQRAELLEEWTPKRNRWAMAELPARYAMKLFERIYELHGMLGREEERLELLIGDGLLRWQRPEGGIEHPLLLQRVELRFDPSEPEFSVLEAESPVELYTDLLRSIPEVDGRVLSRCREELDEGAYHPLGLEGTSGFLKSLVLQLSPRGRFVDESSVSNLEADPEISRRPVLFVRNRSLGFAAAIEQVLTNLKASVEIPDSLLNIVGIESLPPKNPDHDEEPKDAPSTPALIEPEEVLLSLPANPEQVRIAQRLNNHGGVLVQGPPGTGKTHTIANLLGHLLAQGKSVLVTSHTTKALRVLRDKVAPDLQPLCVSVLDSDLDSRRQLESSVTSIVERLSRSDRTQLERQAESLARHRSTLLERIRDLSQKILDARADEYRPIIVAGESFDPSAAARHVAGHAAADGWIPGAVAAESPLPLSPEELIELYATTRSISADDEAELQGSLPHPSGFPPAATFSELISERQALASATRGERNDLWKHSLGDNDHATLEAVYERLRKAVDDLPTEERWKLSVVQAGMLQGPHRELWENLLEKIEGASAESAAAQETILRFAPKPSDLIQIDEQILVTEQIVQHLEKGKRLGRLTLASRPAWKRVVASASINDDHPSLPEHFAALLITLRRQKTRQELSLRWDRQVAAVDGPRSDSLGQDPERAWAQYAPIVTRLLNWYGEEWKPLIGELTGLGFQWNDFLAEQPPQTGPEGELRRLIGTVREALGKILTSKLIEIRWSSIEGTLRDCLGKLDNHVSEAGTVAPAVAALREAIRSQSPEAYSVALGRLTQLWNQNHALATRRRLLHRLESAASAWAAAIRNRMPPHDSGSPPGDPTTAWLFRQLQQELVRRNRVSLPDLQRRLDTTRNELRSTTTQLIACRAWAFQMKRTSLSQQQALIGWLDTVRKIGKGFGVRVPRLRAEARKKMAACRSAVPVWIMPFSRTIESFDPTSARFDVVIIDEASQSDILSLIALLMGRKVVVVGDHEQVSPPAVGQEQAVVQSLIDEHLRGIPNADLYDGRTSIYDLARQSFGDTTCLIEHFRCVPDIIGFSNGLCYDWKIKPLRETSSVRIEPSVVSYRVQSTGLSGKGNREEVWTVASLLVAAVEQPEYNGLTFGVISLVGDQQAIEIDRLLQRHVAPQEHETRRIRCGNAAQFQGDERDVMFLSMVDVPTGSPLALKDRPDFKQRLNVAASRAKDQMWIIHSVDPQTDLKPGDLRRRLLEYAADPSASRRNAEAALRRAESGFEREVLRRLSAEGYEVYSQWPVGHYRIDIVIEGANDRLAVECDGDRFHPVEKLSEDMARQSILERLGWKFARIRGSAFFMDPEAALAPIYVKLRDLGIEPGLHDESESGERDLGSETLRERVVRRAAELRRKWEQEEQAAVERGEDGEPRAALAGWPARTRIRESNPSDSVLDHAQAVADALRRSARPLGRAALIELSGIPESAWADAIDTLKDLGEIVQEGEKRGTVYRLVTRLLK